MSSPPAPSGAALDGAPKDGDTPTADPGGSPRTPVTARDAAAGTDATPSDPDAAAAVIPPSPADVGLAHGSSTVALVGDVERHGSSGSGAGHPYRATSRGSSAFTATSTPASNFTPSYGPSPTARHRDYPTIKSHGAPQLVGRTHSHSHSHSHASTSGVGRTSASHSAAYSTRESEALRRRHSSDGDVTATTTATAVRAASLDSDEAQSGEGSLPQTHAGGSHTAASHADSTASQARSGAGRRDGAASSSASPSSSSDDDGGREWVRTSLARSGNGGRTEATGGGRAGSSYHERRIETQERQARRLTAAAFSFGFNLPSPVLSSGEATSPTAQRGSGADGLLGVPSLTRAGAGSAPTASPGDGIYSLVPSGATTPRRTPTSPSIRMDRAYTSTEAQMALFRQQHEDQWMRQELRAAGVPVGDSPDTHARNPPPLPPPVSDTLPLPLEIPNIVSNAAASTTISGHGNNNNPPLAGARAARRIAGLGHFSSGSVAPPVHRFGQTSGAKAVPVGGSRTASHEVSGSTAAATEAGAEEGVANNDGTGHLGGTQTDAQMLSGWKSNLLTASGSQGSAAGGSGAYLDATPLPASTLRRSVTAPQGVSAAAMAAASSPSPASAGASGKPSKMVSWQQLGLAPGSPGSPNGDDCHRPGGAFSPSSPPGAVPELSRNARSQSSTSLMLNNSFAGSISLCNLSFLKDPLAASAIMQSNRTALIAELERRRDKLKKRLAQLQREATARNIFALVRSSNASQLQYLLQEKLCNVNGRDYNGCTPLHVAAGEGNQAVVSVLLSFGADLFAVDNQGRTALDCAAENRHSGVGRYLLAAIRGRVQREASVEATSTGGGGGGGGTQASTAAPPHTSDKTLWAPRGTGSGSSNSISPPASFDTARPASFLVPSESPVTDPSLGTFKTSLLLAPGRLQHQQQQRMPPHSSAAGSDATSEGPLTPQRHTTAGAPASGSLGVQSSSGSLPVVTTPSYLGGPGGRGGGSLDTLGSDGPRTSSLAANALVDATSAAAGDASWQGSSPALAGSHSTGSTPQAARMMLKPVRAAEDPKAVGFGPTNLLRPCRGDHPLGGSSSVDVPSATAASSFPDVGMQTLDDYRHDANLIRSPWPPQRPRAVVGAASLATAAAAATNAAVATAGQGDTSTAAQHDRSGANATSTSTGGDVIGGETVDSHAVFLPVGSTSGHGNTTILHPWCSSCGLAHASPAVCPAASSAAYSSTFSDDFSRSTLASQRFVASCGNSGTASRKGAAATAAAAAPTAAAAAVTAEDAGEAKKGTLSTPTTAEGGEEPDGLADEEREPKTVAEEDEKLAEAADEAANRDPCYSSYTTVSDTVSLVVCMCGLPGRGKSFISKRLVRYMNWKGVPCKVFNAGNYRRQLLGVEGTANADFFNPDNPKGKELRERMAELACEDLTRFLSDHPLAIGILDATNTTKARRAALRAFFAQEAQRRHLRYRLLFIESVCTDETIITENILRSKCDNDDFKTVKDTNEVIAEFRERIVQYERVYETLEPAEGLPFIKIINIKHHVVVHKVHTGLGSRIAFFLLNLHPIAYPIYIALPGETKGDAAHVYGSDERLTTEGEAYAVALKHFIQDRYVPNMVVLHGTNRSVISTLQPLIADEDDDAFTETTPAEPESIDATTVSGDAFVRRRSPRSRRGGSAGPASEAAVFVHGHHHKQRHIISPTSALEQPLRAVKLQAGTTEELEQLRRMAGGNLQDILGPIVEVAGEEAETLREQKDEGVASTTSTAEHASPSPAAPASSPVGVVPGGEKAAAGTASALPSHPPDRHPHHHRRMVSPNSEGVNHDDENDDEDDDDLVDEVLVPVPGLDNVNYGSFSGCTARWVQAKYPRLSSLLYLLPTSSPVATSTTGATTAKTSPTSHGSTTGQSKPVTPVEKSRDGPAARDKTRPFTEDDLPAGRGYRKEDGKEETPSPMTTPTTVAEILSQPVPPPIHFANMADALACFAHTTTPHDPQLSYCVQFPNGESCRQVNVRLEPALMAVMRTQSPVFVVASSTAAEGMLAFFADVIPELSPTLRLPRHCVIEMGVKDDVTVHRLLPNAGAGCLPATSSSPVLDQGEVEETLKMASSIRSAGHPFVNSQNPESRPEM